MSRALKFRWLLLLAFIPGFLDPLLTSRDSLFAWLNLVNLLACAVLLIALRREVVGALWVWIFLSIFIIGYFAKTYWVAADLSGISEITTVLYPELWWVNVHELVAGFRWITAGFVVFVAVATALLVLAPIRIRSVRVSRPGPWWFAFTVVVFGLLLAAHAVRAYYGIGILGRGNPELHFRIVTIVNRFVGDLGPALLLLAIWMFDESRQRLKYLVALGFLLIHAVIFTVHTTSRGGLLRYGLMVLLLWLASGRLTRKRMLIVTAALLATILIYPMVTMLRFARMEGLSLKDSISQTVRYRDELVLYGPDQGAKVLATRIRGSDAVWLFLEHVPDGLQVQHLSRFILQEPVQVYFTRTILGITNPHDYYAPGMLGTLMFLGGWSGMMLFTGLTVVAVYLYWRVLVNLRTAPVAIAICAYPLAILLSDGGLIFQNVLVALVVALACEAIFRIVEPAPALSAARSPSTGTARA